MTYSFLLVNFNMWGLVERCIGEIIARAESDGNFEIIVADNSTDARFAAPDHVVRSEPRLRIVKIAENKGWVDALNRILPTASGQYVVIMHPDVTLDESCLGHLQHFLEQNPRAGVVSPDLVYPDGKPNTIRLKFPQISVEIRRLANIVGHILLKKRPFRDEVLWDHKSDVQADMVMSVMMMFRRETLRQIGEIDSRIWTYYANDWLCGRARQLGWTCHYLAAARAVHWERHSPTELYSNSVNSTYKRDPVPVSDRMCRDRFMFLRTFYSLPARLAFRVLTTMEYLIHLLAQLKPGRGHRVETIHKYAATIKAAWE